MDPFVNLAQRNGSLTHDSPVQQDVLLVGLEITNMIGIQPAVVSAALQLILKTIRLLAMNG